MIYFINLFVLILFFGCKTSPNYETNSKTPLQIDKSRFLPPERIYHYGSFQTLIQNANSHSIKENVWNNFIRGKGRSNLNEYRSGFYGCRTPAQCEVYGNLTPGQKPWLNIIKIKRQCRDDVQLPNYLYQDDKFTHWYKNKASKNDLTLNDFIKRCQNSFQLTRVGPNENVCDKIVSSYFNQSNVGIVLDEAMPDAKKPQLAYQEMNSWYIKDRLCIETVDGQPNEILQLLSEDKYWQNPNELPNSRVKAIVLLFISVLSESQPDHALKYFAKIKSQAERFSNINEAKEKYKTSDFIIRIQHEFKDCPDRNQIQEKMKSFVSSQNILNPKSTFLDDISAAKYFSCR